MKKDAAEREFYMFCVKVSSIVELFENKKVRRIILESERNK